MFFFFITIRIMRGPIPSMFILESGKFLLPRGIIMPNILSIKLFLTGTY